MTSSKPNWKESNSKPNLLSSLLKLDARLSQQLTLPPESEQWPRARWVAHLGDGPFVFGGVGLVYGLAWLMDEYHLRHNVEAMALMVLATMISVTLIKFGVRRRRPQPPGEFVTFSYDAYSFPSGHAARLAALATGTILFYPLWSWIFVALALSVALARVKVGIHYLSDVIIGLGLGSLMTWGGLMLWLYLSLPQ